MVTACSTAGLNDANVAGGDVGFAYAFAHADTITFACSPALSGSAGPYTISLAGVGTQVVTHTRTVRIDGSDAGKNDVTLDGGATVTATTANGGVQLFYVDLASLLTLSNIALQHGNANTANKATDGYGGAVEAFGNFTATNDVFRANAASFGGGALELARDTILTGPTLDILTNDAFNANVVVSQNGDQHGGGAVDVGSDGATGAQIATISGSTFTGNAMPNTTRGGGGALFYNNDSAAANLSIVGSVFDGNSTGYYGGAINLYYGNASIASSLLTRNTAANAGALYNDTISSQTTTLTGDTFAYNRATSTGRYSGGGAIYEDAGVLNITNTTIVANSSATDGSAIYNDDADPITIAASTINGNTSDAPGPFGGAAIVNAPSTGGTTVTYEPLAIGTSIVYGNVTNAAPPSPGTPTNVVPAGTPLECNGPIIDHGLNLSDYDKGAATNSCGFTQPPDVLVLVGTNIGLGPLGAYGGPALGAPGNTSPTYTERLLAGSPALDQVPAGPTGSCVDAAGVPLTTDQRGAGFVRPFPTACDIGAFEASVLGSNGSFGTAAAGCGVFVGFFAPGGIGLSLRTGDTARTVVSYLSLSGPAGQVLALPLVPRLRVADTLSCTVSDPNAPGAASPVTTATVDARVARSGNPAIPVGTLLRVVATRTAATETVTVSAINPDNSTGAILYTLTNVVQPNSFVVGLGTFPLFTFATPT